MSYVNDVQEFNTHNLHDPNSVRSEISSVINYVKGIADSGLLELDKALAEFDVVLDDFDMGVIPTLPIAPTISFDFVKGTYDSRTWKAWCDQIMYDIEHPSSGISKTTCNAILAINREGWRVEMESKRQKMLDSAGADGFDLSGGVQVGVELGISQEILAREHDAQVKLLIKNFDTAIRAQEFTVTQLNEIEKLSQDLFNKAEAIGLECSRGITEHLVSIYKASVKAFDAQWQGLDAKVRAYVAQAGLLENMTDKRASLAVQKIASALGAINTSMGHSYSGSARHSQSQSFSQSLGNSLSESHGYEHIVPYGS